jgi:RNA polymerase sigma-70 factor (ECF subfamily)
VTAAERSDADLLRAHAAGDAFAFEELVRRHRDRLWAVALRTTRDRDEAADALQDALISAYKAAGSFRGDSAVTTWLHRIVVNDCRDRVAERDTRMVVEEALGQLPAEQRAAIVLVDVEGWSVAETAAVLGVPEGTVKSRCARGRARLAVLLGHLRNPDEPAPVAPRSSGGPGTGPSSREEAR